MWEVVRQQKDAWRNAPHGTFCPVLRFLASDKMPRKDRKDIVKMRPTVINEMLEGVISTQCQSVRIWCESSQKLFDAIQH